MRIGSFDRLIQIHRYTEPVDNGTWPLPDPSYVFSGEVWASKKVLRADEKFSTDVNQRYNDIVARFTTYYLDNISILDRLKDEDGRWWDVKAVTEIGYREGIEIDAKLVT